jgi:hypothetical protein
VAGPSGPPSSVNPGLPPAEEVTEGGGVASIVDTLLAWVFGAVGLAAALAILTRVIWNMIRIAREATIERNVRYRLNTARDLITVSSIEKILDAISTDQNLREALESLRRVGNIDETSGVVAFLSDLAAAAERARTSGHLAEAPGSSEEFVNWLNLQRTDRRRSALFSNLSESTLDEIAELVRRFSKPA